jgi:hypothetical protein
MVLVCGRVEMSGIPGLAVLVVVVAVLFSVSSGDFAQPPHHDRPFPGMT